MRYLNVDNIVFTNAVGKVSLVKDMREFPTNYVFAATVPVLKGMNLDEVASRDEIYGEGAESMAFQIFDFNATAIADAKFNLDNLKTLKIPA